MKVLPAIDLRRGASVQLVGGALDDEKIHLPDPLEVARRLPEAPASRSCTSSTSTPPPIPAPTPRSSPNLLKLRGLTAEVGGGVRDAESIQRLLDLGAARVMVGTRALEEPSWLEEVAFRFPGRLMLAADARGRQVVTRGWTRTLTQDVGALVAGADPLPLAAILVTAVHVEGRESGTDLALMSELVEATRHPLHAAGGIASIDELRQLASAGVAGGGDGHGALHRQARPGGGGPRILVSRRTVRETRETRVEVELERGTDPGDIQTGRLFLDHMLATLGSVRRASPDRAAPAEIWCTT